MIDVKRGDSFLIELPYNKGNILIDTGGSDYYDINEKILTPFLKSRGIKKIDYLFLTHGDLDHMGASINLLKNYKVKNVFTNSYSDTELEKQIKNKIKISKHSLNINGYLFYFLNKTNKDENEDSLIVYTNLDGKKFLFMGDATIKEENYLINTFDITNIDLPINGSIINYYIYISNVNSNTNFDITYRFDKEGEGNE
jgi:competence protein ComEC